jgi:hypothetical protein
LSVPDISMARVGEQVMLVWKPVSSMPLRASWSRFGVGISLPNAPRSA